LSYLKERDTKTNRDNEKLTSDDNEFKMQLERLTFESKEAQITMDGLKEANAELTAELDDVKQQLTGREDECTKETSAVLDEKEKKKAEKMAQMMASFDLGSDVFSDNERSIKKLSIMSMICTNKAQLVKPLRPTELETLASPIGGDSGYCTTSRALSLQPLIECMLVSNEERSSSNALEAVERDYEDLLERNLSEPMSQKSKLAWNKLIKQANCAVRAGRRLEGRPCSESLLRSRSSRL
jgi:kinesin family protein 5